VSHNETGLAQGYWGSSPAKNINLTSWVERDLSDELDNSIHIYAMSPRTAHMEKKVIQLQTNKPSDIHYISITSP
jgi:hypothetical protein